MGVRLGACLSYGVVGLVDKKPSFDLPDCGKGFVVLAYERGSGVVFVGIWSLGRGVGFGAGLGAKGSALGKPASDLAGDGNGFVGLE